MSSVVKRVYTATTHAYGDAIDTPPRHRANPPHSSIDWQIHESKSSDAGVRLIWACEVFEHLAKPPSKFHPHAGKKKPAKKPKPKPKPAATKKAEKKPVPAPVAAPAFAFAPKAPKAPRPPRAPKPEAPKVVTAAE